MNRVASIGGAVGLHERQQRGRAAANRQPAERTAAYGIGLRPFERPSLGREADELISDLFFTNLISGSKRSDFDTPRYAVSEYSLTHFDTATNFEPPF
jgi:hypothetical protein